MAISLSETFLSINRHLHDHHVASFPPQKSYIGHSKSMEFATRSPRIPRVMSKTTQSLSSVIHELQLERRAKLDIEAGKKQQERQLADVWREIHGEDDWVGMLDPMDPLLRSELIRYGEMAQATYDAFDFDPFSKYVFATSNINLPNFFKKSRWPKVWSKNANWIGYVAVSDDETSRRLGRRDITIAWRGTVTRLEWIADLMDFLKPISSNKIPCPDSTVKVEAGFLDLYTDKDTKCRYCKFSAREQILTEVKRLLELYKDEEMSITITGHSLGSALAILSAYDIVETGLNVLNDCRAVPVSVFSISGPRVGNVRFKERLETLGVKVLRVVNVHDIVPKSPGLFFNENALPMVMKLAEGLPWCYCHVGVELALGHTHSPFLKQTGDPSCAHNLEAHLHLLDGLVSHLHLLDRYHGKGRRFVLASGRDPALVNKASDFLKDHYLVPPYWRQDENKGMVRSKDGRWMQPERRILDEQHHPEEIHHHLKQLGLASEY
ncbi:Phospholipase A1-Igamma1 [Hibiscus syriacus]|uniref:Phospholipase A1-Igamma1 n=1 Tax=Hibiscus syriacus TaxID=106335 RepID=A0A6A2WL95_HIBSY|nr:Phospholipase A1-Igamma1 [Hibiscus syriacus]